MSRATPREIRPDFLIAHSQEILEILRHAVHEALRFHKRNGNSVAILRDGKVVILKPDEIELDEEMETEQGPATSR